ncbi:MAG: ABC transporter ATP-binding protein [Nitrososphaeria archaeon]|nr:ABC transporter ATP-binding protein [Nitrososphaeria archaeon]MDW7986237.1 ABC transporter ATP-binding protein [Nitrososphaerota archaeon]
MKLIEISSLIINYITSQGFVKAVDNVSLEIRKGEALAIVGESGSGKSTLALSIPRLLPENARILNGNIWLYPEKIDLTKIPEKELRRIRGRRIGMVFQDPMTYLNPVMKVGDQIAETIVHHQRSSIKEAKEKALELLEKLRIPDAINVASRYPHQLSGGMKQRIMIAIAISCNPELLIADEPTTALDVTVQAEVLELLKNLIQELKTALILVTHDLGIVAEICDKIAIMYAGKLVELADVYSLYKDPKHPYTTGLLNAVPTIKEARTKISVIKGSIPDLINPPSGCRFHPRCPYTFEKCKIEEPPLINFNENRYVACWLVEGA